jgi:DNA-binding transcriptional LysR family regulator
MAVVARCFGSRKLRVLRCPKGNAPEAALLHARMLTYLDEVARAGSIRRAADKLGIAASSINRQILALEAEFGVQIFERLPRRLRLTVAGEMLIAHVRATLREHDMLRSRLIDMQGRRRGLVRIATMSGLANTLMPPLVGWMREHYPFVKLAVRALSLDGVVGAVISAEADLGLGYQLPSDPKLRVLARTQARIGAVVAPGHALAASGKSVSLADCAGFPMVIPDRSITVGVLLADAFERASIGVETVVETNSIELLKRAATLGETVAFLSEIETEIERRRGDLVFLPLRDAGLQQQELRLVARRTLGLDATQSKVAEELGQMLQRIEAAGSS